MPLLVAAALGVKKGKLAVCYLESWCITSRREVTTKASGVPPEGSLAKTTTVFVSLVEGPRGRALTPYDKRSQGEVPNTADFTLSVNAFKGSSLNCENRLN